MKMAAHDVDPWEKSRQFAARMAAALARLDIPLEEVSDQTGISIRRLKALESGKALFASPELQLLGILLGIPIDELFPLELSDAEIHQAFVELTASGVGLLAATGAPEAAGSTERRAERARRKASRDEEQAALERAVVHLHHCAECLGRFPSKPQR